MKAKFPSLLLDINWVTEEIRLSTNTGLSDKDVLRTITLLLANTLSSASHPRGEFYVRETVLDSVATQYIETHASDAHDEVSHEKLYGIAYTVASMVYDILETIVARFGSTIELTRIEQKVGEYLKLTSKG